MSSPSVSTADMCVQVHLPFATCCNRSPCRHTQLRSHPSLPSFGALLLTLGSSSSHFCIPPHLETLLSVFQQWQRMEIPSISPPPPVL